MTPPNRSITRLRDLEDIFGTPADGQVPVWIAATGRFEWRQFLAPPAGDISPPVPLYAHINGAAIVMTFDQPLAAGAPAAAAFAVVGAGSGSHLVLGGADAPTIVGSTVHLTLAAPVLAGEYVRIDYTRPGVNAIQDVDGNQTANFSLAAFDDTSGVYPGLPPKLVSGVVNGVTAVLTFDQPLAASVPPGAAFTVNGVSSGAHAVAGAPVIAGATVTLTLATAPSPVESATVTYVAPGANPRLQDAYGNVTASFGPAAIRNDTAGALPMKPAVEHAMLPTFAGWETRVGSWAGPANSGNYANVAFYYHTVANGDHIDWRVWLDAGTYEVDWEGLLGDNQGIAQILLDGVQAFKFDAYENHVVASGTKFNVGTIVAAADGFHTVRLQCNAEKNVASSDFNVACGALLLRGGRVGIVPVGAAVQPVRRTGWNAGGGGYPYSNLYGARYAVTLGEYEECRVWLDAGTYSFDGDLFVGTNHGVTRFSIDGVPVGTPQPANTFRIGGSVNPGNGNNNGVALATGEIDHYDANVAAAACTIPGALTGIVVAATGWHTARREVTGKNSAATDYHCWDAAYLRRTA